MNSLLIIFGKLFAKLSNLFNFGSGSTWPGHIALSVNKNFIKDTLKNSKIKIILIAGTNGKTTTGRLIQVILEKNGRKTFQNAAGANLLNGIASSLIVNANWSGKIDKDFAIFEIDENILPLILKEITNPDYIIILNLFRDQLDRYGEVNTIARKWSEELKKLNDKTTLILNADDPQIAFLGENIKSKVLYFGIRKGNNDNKFQHASDSTYCPKCNEKLSYDSIYFSHLGDWKCSSCGYKHQMKTFTKSPIFPLVGVYNQYNTNAAVLLAQAIRITIGKIKSSLANFKPAFGRQEILNVDGKKVQILLSKNPTSLNESLKTIVSLNAKSILILLNDRIPDGLDVSWIWDVDFENYSNSFEDIIVSGDRVFDMGLRLKYAGYKNFKTEENLKKAIDLALKNTLEQDTLYILPTYSAMLEARKILTGRKIL